MSDIVSNVLLSECPISSITLSIIFTISKNCILLLKKAFTAISFAAFKNIGKIPPFLRAKRDNKIDLYFEKLQQMPWWLVSLWISIVAAIYGIKATDLVKKK